MSTEDRLLQQIESLLEKLDVVVESNNQILHPKRIPLQIFAVASAGSANKVVVGCIRNGRVRNAMVDSAAGTHKSVWQNIFSGFDDEQPFVMNLSANSISINFDGETPETDNNAILLPTGTMLVYPGLILPITGAIANTLLGSMRLQDGVGTALATVIIPADGQALGTALRTVPVLSAIQDAAGTLTQMLRAGTAAILSAFSSVGSLLVSLPGDWTVVHTPAAAAQATASKAAGAAGVRHICTGIFADFVAGAVAPAAGTVLLNLRDGASGAGTILFSQQVSITAVAGDRDNIEISGLNIVGSPATAMTLEFAAAGGANTIQAITLVGHDAS